MYNKRILALGADIKNRFLIANKAQVYFGPDIGDLSQAKNFELFKRKVSRALNKFKPDAIACDLHPDYFSTKFAREFNYQLSTMNYELIQHHHAHIASVIQEHDLKTPVLGLSFDGAGFGRDGHSWGGEFLLVGKKGFRRLAHLKYRLMPGGDKVISEPWRMVLSILGKRAFSFLTKVKKQDKDLVLMMIRKDINSPLTSSAGRLFDAASALLGISQYASFEAEGPIKLEAISDMRINDYYDFKLIKEDKELIIDSDGLFLGMLKDLKQRQDKAIIASKFHNSMSRIIVQTIKKLSAKSGIKTVALSGGVFQNKFLRTKATKNLRDQGFKVFTNNRVPVNDLNISLGQYYVSCHTRKS